MATFGLSFNTGEVSSARDKPAPDKPRMMVNTIVGGLVLYVLFSNLHNRSRFKNGNIADARGLIDPQIYQEHSFVWKLQLPCISKAWIPRCKNGANAHLLVSKPEG